MSAISTECTNKGAAQRWALHYLQSGNLNKASKQLFHNYAKTWYIYWKCPYIKMRLSKGHRFSQGYADCSRSHLEKHIIPYFGDFRLNNIKVSNIESFLTYLSAPDGLNLSPSSVNTVYQVLANMLTEAYRKDLITENPCGKVLKLALNPTFLSKCCLKSIKSCRST